MRRSFPDGAWMAELAGLRDPGLLASEVARAFGLLDQSASWGVAMLADRLAGRHALLVLDNCEHLLDACAVLAGAHQALGEAVRREARRGGQIRYVQRVLASAERKCLGLFEAPGPGLVRRVHDTAQFPLVRILAVTSSPPPGGDRTADPEEGQPDDSR